MYSTVFETVLVPVLVAYIFTLLTLYTSIMRMSPLSLLQLQALSLTRRLTRRRESAVLRLLRSALLEASTSLRTRGHTPPPSGVPQPVAASRSGAASQSRTASLTNSPASFPQHTGRMRSLAIRSAGQLAANYASARRPFANS